jgi:cytochrome c-type biogenesis protein CcmH/NrfF
MNNPIQPNKKKIRQKAKELLGQGHSKQEVFEYLTEEFKYKKTIADVLEYLPSKKAKEKYRSWNFLLLALLIFTTAIFLWAAPGQVVIFWYGFLIYTVARMQVRFYSWVTALTAFGLIAGIVILLMNDALSTNWAYLSLLLVINIPILILSIWLTQRLTPNPVERKEKYRGEDGRQRLRVIYEFPEKV